MTSENRSETAELFGGDRAERSRVRAGDCLGRYAITEAVGAGGMGEVFRAHDPILRRDVAIKIITGCESSTLARSRFGQEARSASALNHPNIVTIFDIVVDCEEPFIVMELLEGEALRQVIQRGALPIDTFFRIGAQIVDGLATAHERGIIHRDLKPENVFVTREGRVKILDFGLARMEADPDDEDTMVKLTGTGQILGTFGYVAPELASGKPVDFRMDQFSLGCTLYEMATGQRPFKGKTRMAVLAATLRDEPEQISQLRGDLPSAAVNLIQRCLQKDPAGRFSSTRSILEVLSSAAQVAKGEDSTPAAAPRLPIPPTRLFGRSSELESIRSALVDDKARLVVLTGAGGAGKSRLALAAAESLSEHFDRNVFFVSLAGLSDAQLIDSAIASAIGASGADTFEASVRRLRDVPALLVLDNFEHLMEETRTISRILAACPLLSIIVTSREVLRVYGERNIVVPPLELPAGNESLERIAENPAVALFVERARAASSSFQLNDANLRAVATLCRRLDGLPLAIELAAARIRLMTPQAMLERLEQRLPLLTAGSRDLPDRQQTLRRTLDWSHDLLSGDERALFRRVAVFHGGFTLEAAQAVADPFGKLSLDAMEGISSLLDKSLLTTSIEEAEPRFIMLQTVRDYALELLAAGGEEPRTREAHAAYYNVLVQEGNQALAMGDDSEWLSRFSLDHDNIRAAIGWLLKERNASWGLQLVTGMFSFWERAEHLAEGRRWLNAVIELPSAPHEPELYARALFSSGVLAGTLGEPKPALELISRSREVARELNDLWALAVACNALGVIFRDVDQYDDAVKALEESLTHWIALGDRRNYARSLSNLAVVRQMKGDLETAAGLFAEAQHAFAEMGEELSAAWEISHQGDVARAGADFVAAERHYSAALECFREMKDPWGIATSLADLATVNREQGRLIESEKMLRESLKEFSALRHQRGVARVLESLAQLSVETGAYERALILGGAASRIREAIQVPSPADERQSLEAAFRTAREASETELARKAWETGRGMEQSEAIRFASGAQ